MTPNRRRFLSAVAANPGASRPSDNASTMRACQRLGQVHTYDDDVPYASREWFILPAGVAALRVSA